jgi:hypothetical protein
MAVGASLAKTNMVVITVTPTAGPQGRRGYFDAGVSDGRVLVRKSRQPFVDAARRLKDQGYDAAAVLVVRQAGSDTDSLTAQIGVAAKLRVREDRNGPRFVPWEPVSRRVKALARAKAKKAARVATAQTNEPVVARGATGPLQKLGNSGKRSAMSEALAPSVTPRASDCR